MVYASESEDEADSEAEADSEQGEEDDDGADGEDDDGANGRDAGVATGSSKGAGKLWTRAQFPEGVNGAANWDLKNLLVAQNWTCPCADRRNCIGSERLQVTELYAHRKEFQTKAAGDVGKRDATRASMAQHYCSTNRTLSRSFVVGPLNDCCAASAGLASGVAFGTWARARTDLRQNAPLRPDRRRATADKESTERRHLEAYVRELRSSMEGSKGKATAGRFFTGKRPLPQRWDDYVKSRKTRGLPVIGTLRLFQKIWKEHDEIVDVKATGHEICDDCGRIKAARDQYEGRTDAVAVAERKRLDEQQAIHDKEHRGERQYGDDIWYKSETYPDRVTALNMDAPTQDEFDVPVQPRKFRDAVKALDKQPKWASKITGVMAAGHGMIAYVTRTGLGSGPNLSLTLLYLTLLKVAATRGLGMRFNLVSSLTLHPPPHPPPRRAHQPNIGSNREAHGALTSPPDRIERPTARSPAPPGMCAACRWNGK